MADWSISRKTSMSALITRRNSIESAPRSSRIRRSRHMVRDSGLPELVGLAGDIRLDRGHGDTRDGDHAEGDEQPLDSRKAPFLALVCDETGPEPDPQDSYFLHVVLPRDGVIRRRAGQPRDRAHR